MRKVSAIVLLAILMVSLFAQGADEVSSKTEVIVFAASSLTETLTDIKSLYESKNPDVSIICNFDSSGTLKTQIQNGAPCDVFLSAATKQMDALSELGLVEKSTRVDLLENRTTLVVPQGNPKDVKGFSQLVQLLKSGSVLLAIGNADVPVGQYTKRIFDYFSVEESSVAKCLSYGSNVKEVTTQVRAGSVDCGIVYATDAFSAGLVIVDYATAEMCGQVVYPAAVLSTSGNLVAAQAFLDYLKSEEAMAVFASVGFESALK